MENRILKVLVENDEKDTRISKAFGSCSLIVKVHSTFSTIVPIGLILERKCHITHT